MDDPIGQFIDGLPYGNVVTIRHLLTHTNGLRTTGLVSSEPFDRKTTLAAAAEQWPAFQPGTQYLYGNVGIMLLALAVENVTGEDFRTRLDERILRPAGMTSARLFKSYAPEEHTRSLRGYIEERGTVSTKENP